MGYTVPHNKKSKICKNRIGYSWFLSFTLLQWCFAVVSSFRLTTASWLTLNTLRPRQNDRNSTDDSLKLIFLNENLWFLIKISLKLLVPQGPINNIPALVQIIAWRRPGDKPLSEPIMFGLPTHICVTWPQWVLDIASWLTLNTLRPRPHDQHFADGSFKCASLNENIWLLIKFSLNFVPKGRINNIPALVQIMPWIRPGYKPLSNPIIFGFPTHVCVTRPQLVKGMAWKVSRAS